MSNIKGYFESCAYSGMQQQEEARSSPPTMVDEDPILSFPSSQSTYYISSNNPQMSGFVSDYSFYTPQQGGVYNTSSSSAEGPHHHGGLMYASSTSPVEGHHHFMSPNGTFTTTPSPTSSISSSSIPNFGTTGGVMYGYNDMSGFHGDATSEASDFEIKQGYYGRSNNASSGSCSSSSHHSVISNANNYSATTAVAAAIGNHHYHNHHYTDFSASAGERHPHRNGYSSGVNKHKNKDIAVTPSNKKSTSSSSSTAVYVKRAPRGEKGKKRCSNCHAINSPSWRRSIAKHSKGDLLCNACGLYEKTAKKKRMLVTADDGNTKVVRKRDARDYCCSTCGAKDVTRWRRLHDSVQCEKCARSQQRVSAAAHK